MRVLMTVLTVTAITSNVNVTGCQCLKSNFQLFLMMKTTSKLMIMMNTMMRLVLIVMTTLTKLLILMTPIDMNAGQYPNVFGSLNHFQGSVLGCIM